MSEMDSHHALLTPRLSSSAFTPIQVQNIQLAFNQRVIFSDLNFSIGATGITAVMGPNGAGKSLILRLLAGLIDPDQGRVLYNKGPNQPKGQTGFVFQHPVLLRRSVQDNVLHALAIAGIDSGQRSSRVDALLELGAMQHLKKSPARKLSGGEQQRLTLLRALACKPGLLLLDEPSANLDPQATTLIERIILQASQCGVKVVLVTHDQGQVTRLADEVMFVYKGRADAIQSTQDFLKKPASRQAEAYLAGELLLD